MVWVLKSFANNALPDGAVGRADWAGRRVDGSGAAPKPAGCAWWRLRGSCDDGGRARDGGERDLEARRRWRGSLRKSPEKKALKRLFQGPKLVAGAGFEPATFRL